MLIINSLNHLNILYCAISCHEISRQSSSSSGTRENYADAALRFDWIIVGNTRKYNIESRKLSKSASILAYYNFYLVARRGADRRDATSLTRHPGRMHREMHIPS